MLVMSLYNNHFLLFLAANFLFCEIVNQILTFAVCRMPVKVTVNLSIVCEWLARRSSGLWRLVKSIYRQYFSAPAKALATFVCIIYIPSICSLVFFFFSCNYWQAMYIYCFRKFAIELVIAAEKVIPVYRTIHIKSPYTRNDLKRGQFQLVYGSSKTRVTPFFFTIITCIALLYIKQVFHY